MEYVFIAIIALLVYLLIYLDRENRKERERLQLKLMSKTPEEYVRVVKDVETPPATLEEVEEQKDEEDEYLELEDVADRTLLTAKDGL